MNRRVLRLTGLIAVFLTVLQYGVSASTTKNSLPPIRESEAYHQYLRRPVSDLSKIIFLIDRFAPTGVEIYYDGYYFNATIATLVAKTFLAQRYQKETVKQWIMEWCNISIGGNLIYARFPDGTQRPSREVLFDEIKALDKAVQEDQHKPAAVPKSS